MSLDCKRYMSQCKARCCGVMAFDKKFALMHKDKIKIDFKFKDIGDTVYLETEDLSCAFLDRAEMKCIIYDERPEVCRLFSTGKDSNGKENVLLFCPYSRPNGNMWSPAKKKHLDRRINQVMEEVMEKGKRYG
jgi:Fe-S-cluster containining protein